MNTGTPTVAQEVELPHPGEGAAPTEPEPQKKSLLPLIVAIVLIIAAGIGGCLYWASVVLTVKAEDTVTETTAVPADSKPPVALNQEPALPVVTSTPEIPAVPPLFTINEASDNRESGNEGALLDLKEQVDGLQSQLKTQADVLNKLVRIVSAIQSNTEAVVIGTETIVGEIRKQQTSVQNVKTIVEREQLDEAKRKATPNFRIAGKSVWGNVVYITVATDNDFQKQLTIGSAVNGWTLVDVNIKDKSSIWRKAGVEHEIAIP